MIIMRSTSENTVPFARSCDLLTQPRYFTQVLPFCSIVVLVLKRRTTACSDAGCSAEDCDEASTWVDHVLRHHRLPFNSLIISSIIRQLQYPV